MMNIQRTKKIAVGQSHYFFELSLSDSCHSTCDICGKNICESTVYVMLKNNYYKLLCNNCCLSNLPKKNIDNPHLFFIQLKCEIPSIEDYRIIKNILQPPYQGIQYHKADKSPKQFMCSCCSSPMRKGHIYKRKEKDTVTELCTECCGMNLAYELHMLNPSSVQLKYDEICVTSLSRPKKRPPQDRALSYFSGHCFIKHLRLNTLSSIHIGGFDSCPSANNPNLALNGKTHCILEVFQTNIIVSEQITSPSTNLISNVLVGKCVFCNRFFLVLGCNYNDPIKKRHFIANIVTQNTHVNFVFHPIDNCTDYCIPISSKTIYKGTSVDHIHCDNTIHSSEHLIPAYALFQTKNTHTSIPIKLCVDCKNVFLYDNIQLSDDFRLSDKNSILPPNNVIKNHSFLTRTSNYLCVNNNHKLIDILCTVYLKTAISVIKSEVPALYCATCEKYYILEHEYQNMRRLGTPLCNVVSKKYWLNQDCDIESATFGNTSLLYDIGYNVNSANNLSSDTRREILTNAVDSGLMTKYEIMSHLNKQILLRKNDPIYAEACQKWESDIEFIRNYNNDILDCVEAKSIIHTVYIK